MGKAATFRNLNEEIRRIPSLVTVVLPRSNSAIDLRRPDTLIRIPGHLWQKEAPERDARRRMIRPNKERLRAANKRYHLRVDDLSVGNGQ